MRTDSKTLNTYMPADKALTVLTCLALQVCPHTARPLEGHPILNDPTVILALAKAIRVLERSANSTRTYNRVTQCHPNHMKRWLESEDLQLKRELRNFMAVPEIALEHGRGLGAIERRCKKHELFFDRSPVLVQSDSHAANSLTPHQLEMLVRNN